MNIVVDTNVLIAVVIPLTYSPISLQRMLDWKKKDHILNAPLLWEYEAASALRKAIKYEYIDSEQAESALTDLFKLGVQSIPPTKETHMAALRWAERIGQARAYDAQYLSLAEELEAPLWTADKRLANAAWEAGAGFVHWIGEE